MNEEEIYARARDLVDLVAQDASCRRSFDDGLAIVEHVTALDEHGRHAGRFLVAIRRLP